MIILYSLIGFAVALSCLWCFFKGVKVGIDIGKAKEPINFIKPLEKVKETVSAVTETIESKKSGKPTIQEQIQDITNYSGVI